jgi:hypothetical protein
MRLTLNPATSIPVLSPLKTRDLLAVSETNAFHKLVNQLLRDGRDIGGK